MLFQKFYIFPNEEIQENQYLGRTRLTFPLGFPNLEPGLQLLTLKQYFSKIYPLTANLEIKLKMCNLGPWLTGTHGTEYKLHISVDDNMKIHPKPILQLYVQMWGYAVATNEVGWQQAMLYRYLRSNIGLTRHTIHVCPLSIQTFLAVPLTFCIGLTIIVYFSSLLCGISFILLTVRPH